MKVKVGISARHVHLKEEDLQTLFGENYKLTKFKDLTQPGQYAANETVSIKTDKSSFEGVRILGPIRNYTQVEISKTDAYKLKLNPPVKSYGDLDGAETITIIGPKGEVTLSCCILPTRHIHLTNEDREKYNLKNKDKVSLKVEGDKAGIIQNVYIKESENYAFECHLDVDDANAFLIKNGDELEIHE